MQEDLIAQNLILPGDCLLDNDAHPNHSTETKVAQFIEPMSGGYLEIYP